jgi:error-prone DNA polymerase
MSREPTTRRPGGAVTWIRRASPSRMAGPACGEDVRTSDSGDVASRTNGVTGCHAARDGTLRYAELHCLSNFSFLRGASSADELFERAGKLGYAALAITDEGSLAGIVRALEASEKHGVPLIVGSEIRFDCGLQLVLLCESRAGYERLSELITRGRRAAVKGEYRLRRADLEAVGSEGLLALWRFDAATPHIQPANPHASCRSRFSGDTVHDGGTRRSTCVRSPLKRLLQGDDDAAGWLQAHFPDRLWIAVELHRDGSDAVRLAALQALGARHGIPLVAAGDVHMHVRRRRALQDAMTAIRLNTSVAEAGQALFPNGERHLRRIDELDVLYPPELLAETLAIAGRCRFSLRELRYDYPRELVPAGLTPTQHLRALTAAGVQRRFPDGVSDDVRALIEKELALIAELSYEAFFLTVHDIVAWATAQGILCQGRGSAANSVVCYCLGITAVGPDRIHMLFERFISKERNEPPDIDVDFEHERREEVIQYIYGKYGRHRAALAATVICYRTKSAARDLGRALGFSADQLEQLSLAFARGHSGLDRRALLAEYGFDVASPAIRRFLVLLAELRGQPRHLSQHVGGFVISEHPLSRLVPVENAAMPERTIIQWDKDDLETLGLLKVDCLALGMLSCIRRCIDLVERHRGVRHTLASIPEGDPQTYEMIQRGDTLGVFQIESRAQMAMLPRMKPRNFYDLVIEVAIVRPGPIQGDMVHPYLRRRCGEEEVRFASPDLEKVLGRTLGVPIFQEQVMHLAIVAAGFTPGEADQLRRSMAAWQRRGGIEQWQQRIVDGMLERGYEREFAERIFEQIKGFASYGFPESHAASFALLAYVSSWLRCHEPAAYACALLNAQPMGFYAPAQIVADAKAHGVEVRPVDVCASGWECSLEGMKSRDPGRARGRPADGGLKPLSPRERGWGEGPGMPRGSDCDPASRPRAAEAPALPPAPLRTHPHPNPSPGGRGAQERGPSSDCAPLPGPGSGVPGPDKLFPRPGLSLRLGLRQIRGLSEECAARIVAARAQQPFCDVADLVTRARLERDERERLAAAGALRRLAGHRHRAFWAVAGSDAPDGVLRGAALAEERVMLPLPSRAADMLADYASTGLSLGLHPLQTIRAQLRTRRYRMARELPGLRDGVPVRVAGLVTLRQRPETASGVTFVTLEDETGLMNLIVWRQVAERQRRELLESRLLGVDAVLQAQHGVQHLVVRRLHDLSAMVAGLDARSRDFQ